MPFFLGYLGFASALQQEAGTEKIWMTTGEGRW
jgi:hypothetical protein